MQLTAEQEAWVTQQLANAESRYRAQNNDAKPGGKWISEKKQSLELQCYPLSEIITRMLKIGHPDNIHNREAQRQEFTVLCAELDRREKSYRTTA